MTPSSKGSLQKMTWLLICRQPLHWDYFRVARHLGAIAGRDFSALPRAICVLDYFAGITAAQPPAPHILC